MKDNKIRSRSNSQEYKIRSRSNSQEYKIDTLIRKLEGKDFVLNFLDQNTRIVGGLVLQTILDEEWDTDIDIYTVLDFDELDLPGDWQEYPNTIGYISIPGVKKVYRDNSLGIDLIIITDWKTIFAGFDFDFCKCWFDGKDFGMENPESVMKKYCIVNGDLRYNGHNRVEKYRKRGFTIKINI